MIKMWMKNYGHDTPKPTVLFGNTPTLERLMTGKLCRATPTAVETTSKYVDGSGVARWKATSALKGTQSLSCTVTAFLQLREYPFRYARSVVELVRHVPGDHLGEWGEAACPSR